MNLFSEFLNAFRKGQSLANPEIWKNRAIVADVLAGLLTSLIAIAAAFGYRLDLEADAVKALAAGVASAVYIASAILHVTTSDKVGLPPRSDGGPGGGTPDTEEFKYPLGGA